jgi:hypothetical protein
MSSDDRSIKGFCPACRGETLYRNHEGRVVCHDLECPDPHAVSGLLAARELLAGADEREAMVRARKPQQCGSSFEAGWLACREWAERRFSAETSSRWREHIDLLDKAEDIRRRRAEERERVLLEALEALERVASWGEGKTAAISLAVLASPTPQETT